MTILRTRQREHRVVESGIIASFIRFTSIFANNFRTLFVIYAYVLEENSCLFSQVNIALWKKKLGTKYVLRVKYVTDKCVTFY